MSTFVRWWGVRGARLSSSSHEGAFSSGPCLIPARRRYLARRENSSNAGNLLAAASGVASPGERLIGHLIQALTGQKKSGQGFGAFEPDHRPDRGKENAVTGDPAADHPWALGV